LDTQRVLQLGAAAVLIGCTLYFVRSQGKRKFEQADVSILDAPLPRANRKKRPVPTSLIPETMEDVENGGLATMPTPEEELASREQSLTSKKLPPFTATLNKGGVGPLKRRDPKILQLNIGLYCNQACTHCHVESSPLKVKEQMSLEVAEQCLELLRNSPSVHTLDLTGGAPEMNKAFKLLVTKARAMRPDLKIIDRCNLTVLREPGFEDIPDFLVKEKVDIIASLPCYSEANVDKQRGRHVFERSIAGLQILNEVGFGKPGGRVLDLVYNPLGAFLPPDQAKLEKAYKGKLFDDFGIVFNNLFCITNMPIKRFWEFLHKRDELDAYMDLLVRNFNPDTVKQGLMCQDTVSVSWEGKVYDCDFNQQLDLILQLKGKTQPGGLDVFGLTSLSELQDVAIRTKPHCYGCTAGQGSS